MAVKNRSWTLSQVNLMLDATVGGLLLGSDENVAVLPCGSWAGEFVALDLQLGSALSVRQQLSSEWLRSAAVSRSSPLQPTTLFIKVSTSVTGPRHYDVACSLRLTHLTRLIHHHEARHQRRACLDMVGQFFQLACLQLLRIAINCLSF
jgi:hypothetical protein